MSELKLHLPRFDGKPSSDFTLWQIRLQAILESKSLWHVFDVENMGVKQRACSVVANYGNA